MSKKRKERPRREQESPEKQGQEVSSGHSRKRSSATKDTGNGTASQLDYRKSFGGKSEKFTRFVFRFFCLVLLHVPKYFRLIKMFGPDQKWRQRDDLHLVNEFFVAAKNVLDHH